MGALSDSRPALAAVVAVLLVVALAAGRIARGRRRGAHRIRTAEPQEHPLPTWARLTVIALAVLGFLLVSLVARSRG